MSKLTWIGALLVTGLPIAPWFAAPAAGETRPASPPAAQPAAPPAAAPTSPAPPAATQQAATAAQQQRKAEIEAARARCTALLKTINAIAIQQDTIDDGECGSLAPVELVSVGKNPEVALSPPAILNCDMAVAIHDWVKSDIQPLARKLLGREIVRLETMSSYSCRNAYGRKLAKLSEHGKANALDVRGFVTAKGDTAYVLNDWGMTSGEIRAAAAAAQKEQAAREQAAAEAKAAAEAQARALAATKPGSGTAGTSSDRQGPNPIANATTLIDGLSKPALTLHDLTGVKPAGSNMGLAPPSRLGGPGTETAGTSRIAVAAPPPAVAPASDAIAAAKSQFLRDVHDSACRRFQTTLGPETNAAHRNHLHVDLAERAVKKPICE